MKERTETYQINRIKTQHGLLYSGKQNVSKKHIRKRYFKGNLFILRPTSYITTDFLGNERNQYFYNLYETFKGKKYKIKQVLAGGYLKELNEKIDSMDIYDEPSFY